jgi:hypothetical protein
MILAGIPVDSDDIEWLADQFSQLGFLETASKLLFASAQSAETVLLTEEELQTLGNVLDDRHQFPQLRVASNGQV